MTEGDFSRASLINAYFGGADLTGANLSHADLTNADFEGAILTGANFDQANFANVDFHLAVLTGANFVGQNLYSANFSNAVLADADFTNAKIQGAEFSAVTYDGFTAAQLYSTASYQFPRLEGIHLGGNDLSNWSFVGQNLTNADFRSWLVDADFGQANLTNPNFQGQN